MKKTALIALLLTVALALTACGSDKTYADLKMADYVTLGEYKGLTYTPVGTSVSDYALQVAIQKDLEEEGYKVTDSTKRTEGTVQVGDTCDIDFKGLKDGVAFQGGTATGYSLTIGSGSFIAGFEEGLAGVAIGSKVSLNLTFPENYRDQELAGQDVVFEVTVNAVTKRKSFPEITDAIANAMDEQANTVAEYYANKKASLEAENIAKAEKNLSDALWLEVINGTTLVKDIPQKLIDDAANEIVERYKMMAMQYAYDSLDEFLSANNTTMEYFNKQAKAYGQVMATNFMVAYAIANQEGFAVSDELFDEKATEYATAEGFTDVNKYIKEEGKDAICDQIILDYAVDLVLENAVAK